MWVYNQQNLGRYHNCEIDISYKVSGFKKRILFRHVAKNVGTVFATSSVTYPCEFALWSYLVTSYCSTSKIKLKILYIRIAPCLFKHKLTWTGCFTVFFPRAMSGTALPNQRMSERGLKATHESFTGHVPVTQRLKCLNSSRSQSVSALAVSFMHMLILLLTCVVVEESVLPAEDLRRLHDDGVRELVSNCALAYSLW